MIEIPLNKDGGAWRTLSVNISVVSLSIRLLWNGRDAHWFADLESVDGKNRGIRLVVNTPLLAYKNRCLKEGDLVVIQSITGASAELGFKNLGKEFSMLYLTKAEVKQFTEALLTMKKPEDAE